MQLESDLFYFAMRVVRKFIFPKVPTHIQKYIPGLRANYGTRSGSGPVNLYNRHLNSVDPEWLSSKTILEIGIGATNGSCYEMAARGAEKCYAFEPFVPFVRSLDQPLLLHCSSEHDINIDKLRERVFRLTSTSDLAAQSIDVVVSNSVLEHVTDLDSLNAELFRLLRPDGLMLHIVDYRDHFFRFPYHHLLWSRNVWHQFLDPGDLPRWRIGDHIQCFERHGFSCRILKAEPISDEFAKIQSRIHPEFNRCSEQDLQTAYGVLLIKGRTFKGVAEARHEPSDCTHG